MRVLVVTPWFPPPSGSWPYGFIADSALSLAVQGLEVHVLVIESPIGRTKGPLSTIWTPRARESKYAPFESLNFQSAISLPVHRSGIGRRLSNTLRDTSIRSVIGNSITNIDPDLIHVHTEELLPGIVASGSVDDRPLIVTIHGENTSMEYTSSARQVARFRAAFKCVQSCVCVGEPLREYASRLSGGQVPIEVVWNGVRDIACKYRRPRRNEDLRLIAVGNLEVEKGHAILLTAMSKALQESNRTVKLTIIGEGSQRAQLARQVSDLGLEGHVHFTGALPNEAVLEALASHDVFVLPSFREAFGIVYAEAMFAGLLTIGVEGEGPAQFIESGRTGFLVPIESSVELARLLHELAADRERDWERIADNGREYASARLTWSCHASHMLQVYQAAMKSSAGAT